MPKLSVVMPVYNAEKFLKESIESILIQDFSDFEFIIINDGSTDNSLKIIQAFNDSRIKIISRENKGIVYSLNEAINLSKGEYVARMDADDISLSNRFSRQLQIFKNDSSLAVVGSWAIKINEFNEKVDFMSYPPIDKKELRKFFIKHNPFIHPSVMIKKSCLVDVGFYKKSFKHCEDYELWSRLLMKFNGINIPEYLLKYRVLDSSITRSHNLFMRYQGARVRILGFFRLFLGINL